jgi:uncharacterized protein involved in exopolysaccharide biosynthesis
MAHGWPLVAIVVVVGTGAAVGLSYVMPRVYRSETLILYREGIRSSDVGAGEGGGDPARKLGMKLREMVLSRTSLQAIIEEFKLYPHTVAERGYVDAVDEMRTHIAFKIRDGDTFSLSFDGEHPETVQNVTSKLVTALVDENSRNRVEQATITKEFLDAEMRRNELDLHTKEGALAAFLQKHPEFARDPNAPSALPRAPRRPATTAKSKDPNLLALERQAERTSKLLNAPPAPRKDAPPTPTRIAYNKAEADLEAAQKELNDRSQQFTEQHPDVRAAKARVKAAEAKVARIREELAAESPRGMVEPPPVDRAALEAELAKINAAIASYGRKSSDSQAGGKTPGEDASRIVALETEWARLDREVVEARERQKQVEDKQFRASIAANSVSSGHTAQMVVVDPASLPKHPSGIGRTVIVGIGMAVSLALGLLLAVARALFDDRIYDARELKGLDFIEWVAVVPPPRRAPRRQRA